MINFIFGTQFADFNQIENEQKQAVTNLYAKAQYYRVSVPAYMEYAQTRIGCADWFKWVSAAIDIENKAIALEIKAWKLADLHIDEFIARYPAYSARM